VHPPKKAPQKVPRWLAAARARDSGAPGDWLSRAFARAGVLPLHEAEQAIRAGRVLLDGRVEESPLAPVLPASRASLDGNEVSLAWRTRVLEFHKPAGLVTHGSDPRGLGTVFAGLRAVLPPGLQGFGWHAVGRLDRDTTGLLLFTNDEKFAAHVTAPATHLPKRYLARVGARPTEAQLERLRAGVLLDDGTPSLPAQAQARGDDSLALVLTEGRHHQVKQMLNAVGLSTLALHREAVGGLELAVPSGGWRALDDEEVRGKLLFEPRAAPLEEALEKWR
jgi:23S rRNA pseudouridine2605 synthase/16S rRNA pseudouridine516 synthase